MRRILLSLALLIPFAAFALDYSDRSEDYFDAPFLRPEAAGISVLTNLEVIQGYPDGFFHPERTINRAEFLKIALLSRSDIMVIAGDADTCFPDVPRDAWFSRYVCLAKKRGVISGYPDGLFHPERLVNYAEALKILGILNTVTAEVPDGNEWYVQYREGAYAAGVGLPGLEGRMDMQLTRGQMARLAAAYRAFMEGELDEYRAIERSGFSGSMSSGRSSSLRSSSRSSVSSASSVSSTVGALPAFPAKSRFLILGERSEPIASASFFASREPMYIRGVTVVMEEEYESIESMFLIDAQGKEIGRLTPDVFDADDLTWKASFATEGAYFMDKDTEHVLGIEVLLKGRNAGGVSEEMIQVDSFSLTVEGGFTQETYQSLPADIPYPQHQTAQAKITEVTNALKEQDALPLGNDQLVAGFAFRGEIIPQADLEITELEFEVTKPTGVQTTGWELGATDTTTRVACSMSSNTVSCTNIPEELGAIGSGSSRTLRLFADVSLTNGTQNPFIQISLNQPGSISANGAVRWTDGTGNFNWVELGQPVARGTRWE